jgi:L-seryl-tRNA(Ser) seleniumtransferase
MTDPRRSIPPVDALLESPALEGLLRSYPRTRVLVGVRSAVERVRAAIAEGSAPEDASDPALYARLAQESLIEGDVPSLRRVINATGVVLHTNLGRAPLADAAAQAMAEAAQGYSNLEFDLAKGSRGSRYDHCVGLFTELTGAEDALVVNNNAAALMLALNTLARGRGVAVSRGELVEIGGGFRIPEILERSEVVLVEVGSTNRTRAADYVKSLATGDVGALLKVHRSNFRMTGFTEETEIGELAGVADSAGVPLIYDLGSGLLVDPASIGLPPEPRAQTALQAGADVVVISGDKLMGAPQAGVLLGSSELIAAMRRNPMCRALRVDKVTLAGLEATLRLYRDPEQARHEIPTLRALSLSVHELERRARKCVQLLTSVGVAAEAVAAESKVGGGTYPGVVLPSWAVALGGDQGAEPLAAALRSGTPAVVGRIVDERVHLDLRTIDPSEESDVVSLVAAARSALA